MFFEKNCLYFFLQIQAKKSSANKLAEKMRGDSIGKEKDCNGVNNNNNNNKTVESKMKDSVNKYLDNAKQNVKKEAIPKEGKF